MIEHIIIIEYYANGWTSASGTQCIASFRTNTITSITRYGTIYNTAFIFNNEHTPDTTNATIDSVRTTENDARFHLTNAHRIHRNKTRASIAC